MKATLLDCLLWKLLLSVCTTDCISFHYQNYCIYQTWPNTVYWWYILLLHRPGMLVMNMIYIWYINTCTYYCIRYTFIPSTFGIGTHIFACFIAYTDSFFAIHLHLYINNGHDVCTYVYVYVHTYTTASI